MALTFVTTNKGQRAMFINGYKYTRNKRVNESEYWICSQRLCSSRVTTRNGVLLKEPSAHIDTCQPNGANLVADQMRETMRNRATNEQTPLKRIYDEVTACIINHDLQDELAAKFPRFEAVAKSMYQSRKGNQQPLPHTLHDLVLPVEYLVTREGDNFLLHDDGVDDQRILIFCTDNNLRCLTQCTDLWMDGTFKSVPNIFCQLYTIHGMPFKGVMIPLVYCILPNKTRETYQRVFELLAQSSGNLNLMLQPRLIHIDFEEAVRRAVSIVFPQCEIVGCYFHYCQCLWRKIQMLGLTVNYHANAGNNYFRQWIRCHGALGLVPLATVANLKHQLHRNDFLPPNIPNIADFIHYFNEQWMGEWPPIMWNHHAREGPRTNNHLEGYHFKLNKHFDSAHPNIFLFLKTIVDFQTTFSVKLLQIAAGHNPPRPNKKYVTVNHQINNLNGQFTRGEKNAWELLNALSHVIGL